MEIILSGSLGRIGKPLAKKLVGAGHSVTVISSSPLRKKTIQELGAKPAIGRLQDVDFLASTFNGADIVYTMAPPANYFDHQLNLFKYFQELGDSFSEAIGRTRVPRLINMSSIGAHLDKGNGILKGTFYIEAVLNKHSSHTNITHIRPTEIYYNLFSFIGLIKEQGILAGNLAEKDSNVWVSTEDIADCVVQEVNTPSSGIKVRYVASEALTYRELAQTLGIAIGIPDLKWLRISNKQLLESLVSVGMNPEIAKGMVEMYEAIHSGLLYEDFQLNRPKSFGKVKLKDFAKDFATVYQQS